MEKPSSKIAIIGFGNMGKAIYSGLIGSGNFAEEDFLLSNNKNDNGRMAEEADIIILAVKPDIVFGVLENIKSSLTKDTLLISVAARISVGDIKKCVGGDCQVVRVMPNICASVGESMSCWVKADGVTDSSIEKVKFLLNSFGEEVLLEDESLFGVVTVIAGCGPAFFLHLADLFFDFSENTCLDPKISDKLVSQTVLGVSKLLVESGKSPKTLIREITSKGGTTKAVFQKLKEGEFEKTFLDALRAGEKRASGDY